MKPIYLDYQSTTPTEKSVLKKSGVKQKRAGEKAPQTGAQRQQ